MNLEEFARRGNAAQKAVDAVIASVPVAAVPQKRLRLRSDEVMGSTYGAYPWDDWQAFALSVHIPAELAALGRAVIREAWQHDWSDRLKSLCGWNDDGRRMLRLARDNPKLAEKRWNRLLETDGGRYDPKTDTFLG